MFWNLYKVELLSPLFRMKAEHDRSKNKKTITAERFFCSVATVFCKNFGKYSLICLKSQYYFINCSFFFLS